MHIHTSICIHINTCIYIYICITAYAHTNMLAYIYIYMIMPDVFVRAWTDPLLYLAVQVSYVRAEEDVAQLRGPSPEGLSGKVRPLPQTPGGCKKQIHRGYFS